MPSATGITGLIAQHVSDVYNGDNWTDVNLANTLHDITVKEATTPTIASVNTIAALLHHLTYWNRVMVQRIKGIAVAIPDVNGFAVPLIQTEQEWSELKNDNAASFQELAEAIKSFDENRLLSPIVEGHSPAYKNLQGSVEHIHYHLGQIVILKGLLRQNGLKKVSA